MKKFYTFLMVAVAGLFAATPTAAQTAADLVGSYTMTAESHLTGSMYEGVEFPTSYKNVSIEQGTDAATLVVKGFMSGSASDEVTGTYDVTAKTLSLDVADHAFSQSISWGGTITFTKSPLVLKVAVADDGTLTLSPANLENIKISSSRGYIDALAMTYYYTALSKSFPGFTADLLLTKTEKVTIVGPEPTPSTKPSKEDLVGTWTLTYEEETSVKEMTTTFTINMDADGNLTMTGMFGSSLVIPVTYSENGISVLLYDEANGNFFANYEDGSALDITFGEDGSLIFPSAGFEFSDYSADPYISVTCSDYQSVAVKQQGGDTPSEEQSADIEKLVGNYKMTSTVLLSGESEDLESLQSVLGNGTYTVTLTAGTDVNTILMDGFLGSAINEDMESSPLVGKYDEATHTITFTPAEGQHIFNTTIYDTYTLSAPFVMNVTFNEDGTATLTPANEDGVAFSLDSYEGISALLETYTLTTKKSYTIAKEDLVGTWELTYTPYSLETYEPAGESSTTSFYIYEDEASGDLYLTGLASAPYAYAIPVTYSENGISLATMVDETDPENPYMVVDPTTMGGLTAEFGADNTLVFSVVYAQSGATSIFTMDEATAVRTSDSVPTAISAAAAAAPAAQNVKAYTLQGTLAAKGHAATLTKQLPAGLYIIGGKKVLVK